MNKVSLLATVRHEGSRPAARLLEVAELYFTYIFLARLFHGLVDQPHPVFASGKSWVVREIQASLMTAVSLIPWILFNVRQ